MEMTFESPPTEAPSDLPVVPEKPEKQPIKREKKKKEIDKKGVLYGGVGVIGRDAPISPEPESEEEDQRSVEEYAEDPVQALKLKPADSTAREIAVPVGQEEPLSKDPTPIVEEILPQVPPPINQADKLNLQEDLKKAETEYASKGNSSASDIDFRPSTPPAESGIYIGPNETGELPKSPPPSAAERITPDLADSDREKITKRADTIMRFWNTRQLSLTRANQELADTGRTDKLRALREKAKYDREKYWPADSGKQWKDLPEVDKVAVRLAEMVSLSVQMTAARLQAGRNNLSVERKQSLANRFRKYARNDDIPEGFRGLLQVTARELYPAEAKTTTTRAPDHATETIIDAAAETQPAQPALSQKGVDYDVAEEPTTLPPAPAPEIGFIDTIKHWWSWTFASESAEGPGTYMYQGMDATGEEVVGEVEANNREEADQQIGKLGLYITGIRKRRG